MQTTDWLSGIEATVHKYRMFKMGERVHVACSGGPDSVALVFLLRELAPRLALRLHLLHFDHRLRPGSAADLQFVKALAKKLKLPFHGGHAPKVRPSESKGWSPEEWARRARYQFFGEVARQTGIRKIALGHQRDDQAETILMRVIQGTGLRGLQGIRPVTRVRGLVFVRPLIATSRAEILKFLKARSLGFRRDSTNESPRFLRNRIRKTLLPLLEKNFNPQMREALCRLAETSRQELASWDEWVRQSGHRYLRARRNGTLWLDRDSLMKLPAVLQFRLMDRFLHELDPQSGLDFKSWARIETGLKRRRFRISLPREIDLSLTPRTFLLRKRRFAVKG